jgi:hypothetical protein
MYIAEQSPKQVRGGMTTFNQVMITLGILVAYIAGFALKGFAANWRWMLGFGAVPGVALAVGMVFLPHTPRWLLEQDRRDDAKEVLRRSREEAAVGAELDDIEAVVEAQKEMRLRDLLSPRVRPLIVVGCALAVFQQLLGISTVIYFGTTILTYMGYPVGASVGSTVYLGVVNWAFACIAVALLDRSGRRPLLIAGTIGQILGLTAPGFYFHQSPSLVASNPGTGVASVMFYLAAFEISLGPVFS